MNVYLFCIRFMCTLTSIVIFQIIIFQCGPVEPHPPQATSWWGIQQSG